MPSRIQRQRTKGWHTPLCSCGCGRKAIYVGRSSKWGNPWHVSPRLSAPRAVRMFRQCLNGELPWPARRPMPTKDEIRAELAGHDLMCWCPTEDKNGNCVPCHADVLLELANDIANSARSQL